MDAKQALDELESRAFWGTSAEADFSKDTWTFEVKAMRCGAGPYLIVSAKDWEEIEAKVRASLGKTVGDEK
jgi:hypothetical protein